MQICCVTLSLLCLVLSQINTDEQLSSTTGDESNAQIFEINSEVQDSEIRYGIPDSSDSSIESESLKSTYSSYSSSVKSSYSSYSSSSSSEEHCKHCSNNKKPTRHPSHYITCRAKCPCGTKNITLFNADGTIKSPNEFGKFVTSSACQKTYLISNTRLNWTNAYASCASLGMKLVSFYSQNDMDCFNAVIKDEGSTGRWWTSGTKKGCTKSNNNDWKWCGIDTEFHKTWWKQYDSDSYSLSDRRNEECALIQVLVNTGVDNAYYMSQYKCSSAFYYVCEYPSDMEIDDNCVAECPHCHEKDPNLFDTSGNLINPNQYGKWMTFPAIPSVDICPNLYLLSKEKLTWYDANKKCCRLGMKLVSFNSIDAFVCFNGANILQGNVGTWWTSGTDHECTSNTKEVYTWCATNTSVPDVLWTNTKPKDYSECDRCITNTFAVTFPPQSLSATNCTAKYNFACEGTKTTEAPDPNPCTAVCPTCPAVDISLFDLSGNLVNPDQYGTWLTSNTCLRNYLLSNDKLNWFDAYNKCCRLGMRLLSYPTALEFACFTSTLLASFKLGMWWTSGTDNTCESKPSFRWCGSGNKFIDVIWATGEPNNLLGNEKCVQTDFTFGLPASSLYDKNCMDTAYYACEGLTTTSTTQPPTTGDIPDNCVATCPTCPAKDPNLFDVYGRLINPNQYGSWLSSLACPKELLLSNERLSWSDAFKKCCRLGMKLVSIENGFENGCFNTLNFAVGSTGNWWTSGTDEGCTSATKTVWTWCGSGNRLTATYWLPGFPNPQLVNNKCIDAIVQEGIPPSYTAQSNCANLNYYACERSKIP